jgi:hypothetical protein
MSWSAHSPETVALARQRYIEGAAIRDIMAETGMSLDALYYWVDGGPPTGRRALPPLPRRRSIAPRRKRPPPLRTPEDRKEFIARLWRTAEWQVCDIEDRLAAAGQEPAERERDARMLAVLVKTLRELSTIDEGGGNDNAGGADADTEDGPEPRDLDEFRRDLARRMDELVASRTGAGVPRRTEES